MNTFNDIIHLTGQIHMFVRDQLTWEKSQILLNEVVEIKEWIEHMEMDMVIYRVGLRKRN